MKKRLLIAGMFFVGMAYFCNAGQGSFSSLPKDMQYEIMLNYIDDAIADENSFTDAVNKIKNLIVVNKNLDSLINESAFCLKLIKKLAQKFALSDEDVARTSGIKCAQERLKLQKEFLDFLQKGLGSNKSIAGAKFDNFLRRGVDLEWMMSSAPTITPLMQTIQWSNLDAVKLLLSKGANVNHVNNFGYSPLFFAATMYGTVLRTKTPTETTIDIVKTLLVAGADPNFSGLDTNLVLRLLPSTIREIIEAAQKKSAAE